MKKIKNFAIVILSFLLIWSCNREKNLTFSDWDKNNDSVIDHTEFTDVFTANYYDDWNMENDEYLDDEDFYQVVYNVWDVDDDEQLTEEEWLLGYDYYYGNYVVTGYKDIDVDDDEYIVFKEYYDAIGPEFFLEWDLDNDGRLDQSELAQGIFARWDIDNSGVLEKDEYNSFDTYYLDI